MALKTCMHYLRNKKETLAVEKIYGKARNDLLIAISNDQSQLFSLIFWANSNKNWS